MRNVLITSVAAMFVAGSVSAADLSGSVGVEVTENSAGDYVAETTLGFGVTANTDVGVAFGGFTFESVDGGNLTVDEWQLGMSFGETAVSFGDQGDVFVGGRMEMVGESTLSLPNDEVDSVIVSHGAVAAMVGFDDVTTDISDVSNVQLAYTTAIGTVDLISAVDFNNNTDETTLGVDATYAMASGVDLGAVMTYAVDAEAFGYEAYVDYKFATVFTNGTDDDAFENIGLGVAHSYSNLDVYAEAEYNIDDKDTVVGVGVSFNF